MEYENIKQFKKIKEDAESIIDVIDTSEMASRSQQARTSICSIGSAQSAPYHTFCKETHELAEEHSSASQEQKSEHTSAERRKTASPSATYSYPKRPTPNRLQNDDTEEGYAYAMTEDVATKRNNKQKSQSTSQVSKASESIRSISIVDQPLPLPPSVLKDAGQSVIQLGNNTTVSASQSLVRKGSGSDITGLENYQYQRRLPAKPFQRSTSEINQDTFPRPSIGAKPLVMKVLPLYFCVDDGRVYADRNTASIPTHHLVEVSEDLEKKIGSLSLAKPLTAFPRVSFKVIIIVHSCMYIVLYIQWEHCHKCSYIELQSNSFQFEHSKNF